MKKLLSILFVLIITSCSKEVPSDQLVERNGVYYEVNSQTGFTGTSISYDSNGHLLEKTTYKNGKYDGTREVYWENGKLMMRETYKNGKRDGISETYYKNGKLLLKSSYKDGEPDGVWETYYENGKVEMRYSEKEGERWSELYEYSYTQKKPTTVE